MAISNATILANAGKTIVSNAAGSDVDFGGYVSRGDPSAWDFTEATLVADGVTRTLSLSSIIPVNAKLVHLRIQLKRNAAGQVLWLRKVGVTNNIAVVSTATQVANINAETSCFLDCIGQQIAYSASAGTWAYLRLCVLGWII